MATVKIAAFALWALTAGMSLDPELPIIDITHEIAIENVGADRIIAGDIIFTIPPGWHLYAPGAPKEYVVLTVEQGDGPVGDLVFSYPEGVMTDILGEMVPLYDGVVKVGFHGKTFDRKNEMWNPIVTYQACSDRICLTPEKKTLSISLKVDD